MKPTIKISLLVSVALVIFLGLECKKKPVEPNENDKLGRRDYTWTIDTLSYPGSYQTTMRDMYAVDAKNIYVVGHNDQNRGHMYHYDGNIWKPVGLHISEGGQISGAINLFAIYGFGANNIWAVGSISFSNPTPPPIWYDSSLIIHFDGSQWSEVSITRRKLLPSIGGTKQNLWAGGLEGTLYHFNGSFWSLDTLPVFYSSRYVWGVLAMASLDPMKTVMSLTVLDQTNGFTTNIFLMRTKTSWQIIDSFKVDTSNLKPKWGHARFWTSPQEKLYSVGHGLFVYANNTWKKLYQGENALSGIGGTREKHMFVSGAYSTLLHYNGKDWYSYSPIADPTLGYSALWCSENEVFVLANDGYKTFIIHGK